MEKFIHYCRIRIIIIVCLLPLSMGCVPQLVTYRPLPELENPASFLQTVLQKENSITDLSATARLKISSPNSAGSARAVIFARKPAYLRIETFNLFNQLSLLFVTDGNMLHLFYPSSNSYYTGKASAENLSALFGAKITPENAVSLFLGHPPSFDTDPSHISWRSERSWYVFTISGKENCYYIWIDARFNLISKYALHENCKIPVGECIFSNFKAVKRSVFIPQKIDIFFHQSRSHLSVIYNSFKTNELLEQNLFSFTPPQNATRLQLETLSNPW